MTFRAARRQRGSVPGLAGLWLVLLLVLGIVAMHDLGGGRSHHAGPPATAGEMTGSMADTAPSAPATDVARGQTQVQSALPEMPSHVMAMCLAILLGVVVVAVRRHLIGSTTTARVTLLAARRVSRPLGRGPPRDLLAQLCILRT